MKIKKWLAMSGAAALFGGMLLVGIPAAKALAAGGPPAGGQAGQVMQQGNGMRMGRDFGSMAAPVAQFLGIDQADLIAARHSGKSMVQIASEKGIGEQQLVDYVVGQRSAQIDQMVTDGKITQAQADLHKQFMTGQVKTNLNRTDVGPKRTGDGMGKGFGRGAGNGPGTGVCPYNAAR
jgi:hypothetical protein